MIYPHEAATIRAFLRRECRPRWREALASPARRARFLDRLDHGRDLSATEAPDGREAPLEEAASAAERGGWGTILGCLPGRLACVYEECGERRLLLERTTSTPPPPGASGPPARRPRS